MSLEGINILNVIYSNIKIVGVSICEVISYSLEGINILNVIYSNIKIVGVSICEVISHSLENYKFISREVCLHTVDIEPCKGNAQREALQ